MKIRFYDCHFGDCFKLCADKCNPLIVDFGIQNGSVFRRETYKDRYKKILKDFNDNQDFLLTHYHTDHYEGAIYASNNNYKFNDVYIPDVWKCPESVDVVALLLLRGLITKSYLKNGLTIIDFLISICKLDGRVHFVKRGLKIQDNYVALWPTYEYIDAKKNKLLEKIKPINVEFYSKLRQISNGLVEAVLSMVNSGNYDAYIMVYEDIKISLERLGDSIPEYTKYQKLQLSRFGNEISIVFQNETGALADKNVLFTGDIKLHDSDWKIITKNLDNIVSMFEKYDVIKIPHHGTHPYYTNNITQFIKDSKLLIPNGENKFNWNIDEQYSDDANATNSVVICSDNANCNEYLKNMSCGCKNCQCITGTGNFYVDITI